MNLLPKSLILKMLPQFEIREHRLRFADPNISGSYTHKEVCGIGSPSCLLNFLHFRVLKQVCAICQLAAEMAGYC